MLDNDRPDWYRNDHSTQTYGVELQASLATTWGITTFGGEFGREDIRSSNLGDHSRDKGGVFAEQRVSFGKFDLSGGAFACQYEEWGWKFYPGIDEDYHIVVDTRWSRAFGSIEAYLSVTNLFNESYREISSVEMPGRWVKGGLTLSFR